MEDDRKKRVTLSELIKFVEELENRTLNEKEIMQLRKTIAYVRMVNGKKKKE